MLHVTVRGFLSQCIFEMSWKKIVKTMMYEKVTYTALLSCCCCFFAHFYELYHYVTINLSMFLLKVENKSHFCFELLVSQVNHLVSSCCV